MLVWGVELDPEGIWVSGGGGVGEGPKELVQVC